MVGTCECNVGTLPGLLNPAPGRTMPSPKIVYLSPWLVYSAAQCCFVSTCDVTEVLCYFYTTQCYCIEAACLKLGPVKVGRCLNLLCIPFVTPDTFVNSLSLQVAANNLDKNVLPPMI